MAAVAYLGPNVVESFWTTTDSAGAYQIRGLPAAAYKVAYPAPGNGGRGRIAYQWHGAYDPADSPFVVLGNGDNVALADDELQRVLRVAGADRFETAVQVSRKWGGGVDVFITTGLDFPDALAAGAPAGFLPGSILLISPTSISGSVLTEIARLSPANIWIVGGSAVVPDAAVDRIRQVAVGANFLRLSGSDRYSTATSVANNIGGSNGEPVYVATGTDFPDALVGASAAGYRGGVVVLTHGSSLIAPLVSSLGYIAPSEVVVLGGSGAIPASVEASLVQLSATSISLSFTVKRLSGADRYATAAAVSADTYASAPVVLVATGDNFPDALAGSSLSGFYGAPILLVAQDRIPSATAAELTRLKPSQIVILGGSGAVSSRVESQLAAFVTR